MAATEEKILGRGAQMRALVISDVPDNLKNPRPEWEYKRSRQPSVVLRRLWGARQIIRSVTERNLRVRYKQSILGFAWALLTPLGLLAVLTVTFGRVAGVPTGGIPYPLFAYLGLLPWTFFASALSSGGNSIVGDKVLLNKAQFPREAFPLSAIAVAMVDTSMALVPLMILLAVSGVVPAVTTPLAILPVLVLLAFATGVSLALSALIVHLRDLRAALPLILQIGLFATPVAYPLSLVPSELRFAYCVVNPVAPVIDTLRRVVVLGDAPQWGYLGAGAVTAFGVLVGGYVVFKKLEGGLADVA